MHAGAREEGSLGSELVSRQKSVFNIARESPRLVRPTQGLRTAAALPRSTRARAPGGHRHDRSGGGPDQRIGTGRRPYPWLNRYPKHVDWHQEFARAPAYHLLDASVARYGNRPCTSFLGKTLTYGEIGQLVQRTAAGLQALGVKKGTKVGLFMPNCPTFIVYYFAILKAGGTVVNYNPLYSLEELTFQVRDSETDLMVTLDLKVLFDKVEALMRVDALKRVIVASFAALLPGPKSVLFKLFKGKELAHPDKSPVSRNVVYDADVLARAGGFLQPPIDPDNDIAVLQYTGGTTGTPKGAMLSHANVSVNAAQSAAWADRPRRGTGAGAGGPAVLPRVRHDRGHELRRCGRARRSSSCRASSSTTR